MAVSGRVVLVQDIKAHMVAAAKLHSFLSSALGVDDWLHVPGSFTLPSQRGSPGAHLIRGWVGPRAVLDALQQKKLPCLYRVSNDSSVVQPLDCTDSRMAKKYYYLLNLPCLTKFLLHNRERKDGCE
jgi:hypothetical protein